MNALTFPITCPRCGQHVRLANHGRVAATELNAVVACAGCGLECGLHLRLIPVADVQITDGGCGTNNGYQLHQRNGTTPCGPCKAAHAAVARDRRHARTYA